MRNATVASASGALRPTSGGNRFREPQPPEAWTGVHDALTYPHMAPQPASPIRGLFES